MPRRKPHTPLHCRRCVMAGLARTDAEKGLRVERGAQYRRINGERRRVVTVICPTGHEWWSMHLEALGRADKRDERAREKSALETAT